MPVTPLATAFLLLKLTCLVLTLLHPFYVGKAPAKKGTKAKNAAAVEDAEDQENAKSKSYCFDEEETVLTYSCVRTWQITAGKGHVWGGYMDGKLGLVC